MTGTIPSFTVTYLHVIILSGIKVIQSGKEDLRDGVVSNDRGVCRSKIIVNHLYSH